MPDGYIQLILGPMFSGKSTELLRLFRRFRIAGKRCLLVKYGKDLRYSEEKVVSHDMMSEVSTPVLFLEDLEVKDVDVILIDEGQFFPDIVEKADQWASEGKIVIIAGLDGDYRRIQFGHFLDLIPLAEKVSKLSAICMKCRFREAAFTHHITPFPSGSGSVDIGGADKYMALCRTCYVSEK